MITLEEFPKLESFSITIRESWFESDISKFDERIISDLKNVSIIYPRFSDSKTREFYAFDAASALKSLYLAGVTDKIYPRNYSSYSKNRPSKDSTIMRIITYTLKYKEENT